MQNAFKILMETTITTEFTAVQRQVVTRFKTEFTAVVHVATRFEDNPIFHVAQPNSGLLT